MIKIATWRNRGEQARMSSNQESLGEVPRMRRNRFLAAMAALVVLASACGTSSGGNAQAKVGGTLTIDNESGGLWSCAFNPFNGSVTGLSVGIFYEPLVYDNLLTDKRRTGSPADTNGALTTRR